MLTITGIGAGQGRKFSEDMQVQHDSMRYNTIPLQKWMVPKTEKERKTLKNKID